MKIRGTRTHPSAQRSAEPRLGEVPRASDPRRAGARRSEDALELYALLPRRLPVSLAPLLAFSLSLLLAFTASAATAAPDPGLPATDSARAAWRDSLRLEATGKFSDAATTLAPLPRTYAVHLRLGWLHYLATNHVTAIEHYRAAIAAAPQSLEARLGLLEPLLAHSQFSDAETTARAILEQHPRNLPAILRLAVALRRQGKLRAAHSVLFHALPQFPSDSALLTELGLVAAEQKNLPAARGYFKEAATVNPDNDTAFSYLFSPTLFRDLAATTGPNAPPVPRLPSVTHLSVSVYGGYLAYERTALKRHAILSGAAGFLTVNPAHALEGGVDHIDITRNFLPHLRQTDATFAYANNFFAGIKLRLGGHFVASDDAPTDGAWAVFGSADFLLTQNLQAGAQLSHTRFADYTPALDVWHFTPRLATTLWREPDWTLGLDTRAHWIHLSTVANAGRRDFFSVEPRLVFTTPRWAVGAFAWAGAQAFALRADGYTLFNLAERHTAGFGGDARFTFTPRTALALRYAREEFRELGARNGAAANTFLGTLAVTF